MSRGFPSMTALLGLLAVAGYQHRDKLGAMLGSVTGGQGGNPGGQPMGGAGNPAEGGRFGGQPGQVQGGQTDIGGMLGGGLRDLMDRFRQAGHGETADSWVRQGPNKPIESHHLEGALGAETLDDITRQTGLSRQEIVARLSKNLPDAVDKYTPDGRLPG